MSPNVDEKELDPIPLVDLRADYEKNGPAAIAAMTKVAEAGQFILGPQVTELEQALSNYVQPDKSAKRVHCIGVSDGTAALQLSLMALQLQPGDEVITTPFTWISSAEVIPLVGATPVFADIDPTTFLLDLQSVRQCLSVRTRAVITVSLFGLMSDFAALRRVLDDAQRNLGISSIALIEDGAQSFGAVRNAAKSCASPFVTLSTTSFFPTKPLACYGDGGAVFTTDDTLADTIRALRVHGKMEGLHHVIGMNARLDTVQAAVLLVKFRAFPDALGARRRATAFYNALLSSDARVVLPTHDAIFAADASAASACAVYTVRVARRDAVVARLRARGVSCAIYYPTPCHLQPVFRKRMASRACALPVSEAVCSSVLSLPMHAYLTDEIQARIVRELCAALDELDVVAPPV